MNARGLENPGEYFLNVTVLGQTVVHRTRVLRSPSPLWDEKFWFECASSDEREVSVEFVDYQESHVLGRGRAPAVEGEAWVSLEGALAVRVAIAVTQQRPALLAGDSDAEGDEEPEPEPGPEPQGALEQWRALYLRENGKNPSEVRNAAASRARDFYVSKVFDEKNGLAISRTRALRDNHELLARKNPAASVGELRARIASVQKKIGNVDEEIRFLETEIASQREPA
jgi:hypothetical protein